MTCASPRLDPTLAYPVPLRPSVFQHARFIDKMQPGMTKVKQEKYEIFQDEPLKDGKYTRRVKFRLQLLFCFKQLVFSTKKGRRKCLATEGVKCRIWKEKISLKPTVSFYILLKEYYCVHKKQIKSLG